MGDDPILDGQVRLFDRILSVLESGLMMALIGIVAGLAGTFIDGRFFMIFTPFTPVAIYRSEKALRGLERPIPLVVYCLSTVITAGFLLWFGIALNHSRLGTLTQDAFAALISKTQSISITTTEVIPPPRPSETHPNEDDLLIDAKKEVKNCNAFLTRSTYREANSYGVGPSIEEQKQKLQDFKHLEEAEPSGISPGRKEQILKNYQADINRLEGTFSEREMQIWNKTYGPEFEPVYRRMMESVSDFRDFDDADPMKNPKDLNEVRMECKKLDFLISKYGAKQRQ